MLRTAACVVLALLCTAPVRAQFYVSKPPYPINHVVVIVQENRTVDNFFNGYPGANTTTSAHDSTGTAVTLQSNSTITTTWDPGHSHSNFVAGCNALVGKNCQNAGNSGFDQESCNGTCSDGGGATRMAFWFTAQAAVQPYWDIATEGTLADETFQSNEGPSLANHIYTTAASSRLAIPSNLAVAENITGASGDLTANCQHTGATSTVDMTTAYPGTETFNNVSPACVEQPTITDAMEAKGLSWKWIMSSANPSGNQALWSMGVSGIKHICGASAGACNGADWAAHVIVNAAPDAGFDALISAGTLPNLTFVIPTDANSDHPNDSGNGGPDYVAGMVNTVGKSAYWNNTVICIYWDDWGGWFDHVVPPIPKFSLNDPNEYGFRTPLECISAYSNRGHVSHTVRDQTSVLHMVEDLFQLNGPIGPYSIEQANDDLLAQGDVFNWLQTPLPFTAINLI